MAADNTGGAFLGAVFWELLKVVTEEERKALKFKAELEKLKSTIESIAPIIQEMEKLNRGLDLPERETARLKQEMIQGIELVRICSKVKFNYFQKVTYTDKLIKLNRSIENFCNVNVQVQMARDNKKILSEVSSIGRLLSRNENGSGVFAGTRIDKPCSAPEAPESTPGLDVPLKELRMELLKDDRMQVIVASGPPGAGKTTLAKKICADSKVKEKFEDIFFVTVSSTPDVKVIVQRILEHKHCNAPMFLTDEDAVNDLERLLKEEAAKALKATLLVLDDVWSEFLVYKFKFKLPNYKILVTSRYVFSQFGSGFRLKPLNEEDAMTLFRSSVMTQDGEPSYFDENLAKKIIKICKGSPLILTVVGRSLCGESAAIWQSKVKEWDRGVFASSDAELLSRFQSSLNALDDKVKECYMDLGSFPEDQRISVPALIDMWMEMHEWVEEGLSAINYLHELSKRNLVNLFIARQNASDDGCYNDHFVTQHDLLRELVIHQSKSEPIEQRKRLIIEIRGNNFPKWWSQETRNPTQARLLSISTDENFSLCWYDMNAPEVEVVVLNLRTNKYTLPNFLENMGKLTALIVTNNGLLPSELSNFSLLGSDTLSNLKRIRLEHISIPSFDVQIPNLQKISLVMCNVGQAFKNSTLKISDAFPNLLEFEIDYCNDLEELPDGVCDIVPLKKLSITNCHKLSTLPDEIEKLLKLEELRLASWTDLSALPDKITRLPNVKILDISDCLGINQLPTQIGKLCSLETICTRACSGCEVPNSVIDLGSLNVVKCDEETADREAYKPFGYH